MVEGVVTDAVPTLNDHPEFVWMLPYVVTYHEEGGFDVVLIQQVEHPGSYFGDRAIVESQINGFSLGSILQTAPGYSLRKTQEVVL